MVSGIVHLVGAGPGAPDLLTIRARRLLDTADVVCYDSLTGEGIVDSIPEGTEQRHVGKTPSGERTPQSSINELLVDRARAGQRVVRLKGGDPTVFGRGGEEIEHLAAAGVAFEVVPGVSSVLTPNVLGIPLTHRDHASSLTVITGHEDPSKDDSALDWSGVASTVAAGGTLIILMGVRRLPENVRALQNEGLAADTPVAMIEKATWEDEGVVTGTLDTIVDRRDSANIAPPAITIVGDVVAVRDRVSDCLQRGDVPTAFARAPGAEALLPDGGTH